MRLQEDILSEKWEGKLEKMGIKWGLAYLKDMEEKEYATKICYYR